MGFRWEPDSVEKLAEIWPSISEMARDLCMSDNTLRVALKRGTLSVRHWYRLVNQAQARGFIITYEHLAKLHTPKGLI